MVHGERNVTFSRMKAVRFTPSADSCYLLANLITDAFILLNASADSCMYVLLQQADQYPMPGSCVQAIGPALYSFLCFFYMFSQLLGN